MSFGGRALYSKAAVKISCQQRTHWVLQHSVSVMVVHSRDLGKLRAYFYTFDAGNRL